MDDASDLLRGVIGLVLAVAAALIAGRNAEKKGRRTRLWLLLCFFVPPLLLILLLLPPKIELPSLYADSAMSGHDSGTGQITVETRQRGLFGKLVAFLFWGWQATMIALLVALVVQQSGGTDSPDVAFSAGLVLLVVWLVGAAILGLMMLFTRGKKITFTRQI